MASRRGGSPQQISTALYETLDSVVAPATRDALLRAALDEADEGELPTDHQRFRTFVDGPLRKALTRGLGAELGETVTEELERMLELLEPARREPTLRSSSRGGPGRTISPPPRRSLTPPSQRSAGRSPASSVSPRRSKSPRPATLHAVGRGASPVLPPLSSAPPPLSSAPHSGAVSRQPQREQTPALPPSAEYPSNTAQTIGVIGLVPSSRPGRSTSGSLPFVLVATRDSNLMRKLTAWLDPRAAVLRARSLMSLLHDLEDASHARTVIVVDCKNPSISPTAVAALADELPLNTQVVLWGVTPDLEQALLAISTKTAQWLMCDGEVRAKEIAARCVELVS